MILTEYTGAGCGATVDELLVVSGETPVGSEVGAIKTDICLDRTVHRADKGRVNKTRERIVGAICRAAFGFGMEDLESRFDELLPKSPILVREVRRIYDKTYYSTGVFESGECEDPHEQGFEKWMSGNSSLPDRNGKGIGG